MVKSDIQLYRFGEFQLDTVKRVLLHDNSPVQLPSRAFDVLLALVEHNQCVIDKDELMQLVWGDRVVEENNLTRHISTLRKALEESPNDHRYIVTLPGRGYSFVAPVEEIIYRNAEPLPAEQDVHSKSPRVAYEEESRRDNIDQLRQVDSSGDQKSVNTRVRISRPIWIASLIAILILASLASYKLIKPRRSTDGINTYRDWDIVRLTRDGGSSRPDISRDGKYVAYVNSDSGRQSIWIHQLGTSVSQQVVPPQKYLYFELLFNQDASELYFTRREGSKPQRALYRVSMLGGVARKLRDDIDSAIVLSPDGKIGFVRNTVEDKSEFIITNSDGVEERVLVDKRMDAAAWSPDGRVIVYSVGSAASGGDNMSVHEIHLDDGSQRELSSRKWTHVGRKKWLPDGSGIVVVAREQRLNVDRLWLVNYPSGETRPLSNDLESFNDVSLAGAGNAMVAEQILPVCDIWRGPLSDSADAKKVGVWGMSGLSLMPDGQILYSAKESAESNEIWMMHSDGKGRKRLTFDAGNDTCPLISPDARYIVWVSNRTGNFEIWRMNIDGGNLVQLTNSTGANMPGISPDGKWVTYLAPAEGKLYKVPLDGGEAIGLGIQAVGASAVSPDCNLIGYFFPGRDGWGIAVASFKDGSAIRKFDYDFSALNNRVLKWTPDGKALLYASSSDDVGDIWMCPLDGSPPRRVTQFKSDRIFHFDISSDGRGLICARGGWKHDIVLIKNLR